MKPTPETVALLQASAREVAGNAYSPYSRFQVGAAVISESGQIFSGCNVENASFSLTQCAERNAINTAIASGVPERSLVTLLVYTPGDRVFTPCGACRQVMHELMAKKSYVIACCDSEQSFCWSTKC